MRASDGAGGELAERGFAVWRVAEGEDGARALRDACLASPSAVAERLLGVAPLHVECQPIRPLPAGRSIASGRALAPLHTDSQSFLGAPAAVQILVCVRPAPRGGESVLVDGTRLLVRLERDAPALARALFEVERKQPFYFGEVVGPTIARRRGHLTWTVAPGALGASCAVGQALLAELVREEPIVIRLEAGDALVASNCRMLHGRWAFDGPRELVRLLVWLAEPLPAEPRHLAAARELSPPLRPDVVTRLRAVLALLRGEPPARVAIGANAPEATIYAWRDAFTSRGLTALEEGG